MFNEITTTNKDTLFKLTILYMLFSSLCPTYAGIKFGSMPILNIHRVIGFLLMSGIVANSLLSRRWYHRSIFRIKQVYGFFTLVTCFFIWRLLSAFVSVDVVYSLFIVFVDILLQYSFFLVVIILFDGEQDVVILLNTILFGALLVVLACLAESAFEQNLFFWLAPSSSLDTAYIASAISEKIREIYRVQGAFLHPLVLAEYLILVIPVSVFYLLFPSRSYIKICALLVLVGGVFVLIRTDSRSGLIAFGIQSIVFFTSVIFRNFKKDRRSTIVMLFAILSLCFGLILAYLYGSDLIVGRSGAETSSSVTRIIQIDKGIDAVTIKPLYGWGPGLAANYASVENPKTGQVTVDNYYLTIAVESGMPALFLFLLVLTYSYFISWKIARQNIYLYSDIAEVLSCSIIGFAIFCMILSIYEVFSIFFALIGIMLVIKRNTINFPVNK